jgi:DNA invertase Pin-like site-specific DNA recombinase
MLIGYARIINAEEGLATQRAALKKSRCARILCEKKSSSTFARPVLEKLLPTLGPGDVLIVTRLDRLARSTRDLLAIIDRLRAGRAGFRSLAEPWADTTTRTGRIFLTVATGIAEFERSLIADRTSAGRRRARQRGVRFGPKPKLSAEQLSRACRLLADGKTVGSVAAGLKCHRATLYRALAG